MVRSAPALAFAAAVGLALGAAPTPAAPEESESEEIRLRWAFGARPDADAEPSAIARDTPLRSGTRLKFMIQPLSKCSVYLIHQDSKGEIHLLYPESTARFAGSDPGPEPTYVPPGSHWFELDDHTGLETFFLLAAADPLLELQALIGQHAAAAPGDRPQHASKIIAEIRRLHRAHRDFTRPVEKPVIIGGRTRGEGAVDDGGGAGIDRIAVEISAERFYSKTITIEHEG